MFRYELAMRRGMVMVPAFLALSMMTGISSATERLTYADLVGRLTDLERLATPIVPGEKTSASTSHDRGMSYDPSTDTYRNLSSNRVGGG